MNHQPSTSASGSTPRGRNCVTCRHWDVRIIRTTDLLNSVARCLLPEARALNLVVSGSGGCDKWFPQDTAEATD